MPTITNLPATSAVDDDAEVPISQGGVTVKATVAQMRGATSSGVSSVNGLTGVVNLAAGDVGATPDPDEVSPVSGLLGTETLAVLQGGAMVQATTQQIADLASGGTATDNAAFTVDGQPAQSGRYLMRDGTWRDPAIVSTGQLSVGTPAALVNDSQYLAWPVICRLRDRKILLAYTRGDSHHDDNTGVCVGKIGAEDLDGTVAWGSEFEIYDHPSLWTSVYGVSQVSSGRIFATLWRNNASDDSTAEAGLVYSDDEGATWSAWVDLGTPSGFTGITASAGPVVELANGDLLMTLEGNDSGDAALNRWSKALRSTDNGETWGDPVTVRDYADDTRPYYETKLLLLDDGSLLAIHRTSAGTGTHYISKSTDGGATWSAPYAAFDGFGAPSTIQLAGGMLVAITRRNSDSACVAFTSLDRGLTWGSAIEVDSSMYEMEYGAPVELLDGRVLVAYGYQPSSAITNADIYTAVCTEVTVDTRRTPLPPTVDTRTGTAVDLESTDAGRYLRFTNASAKTYTARPESTEALPPNFEVHGRNVGAADLTITAGSGVTINAPAGGTLVVPQRGTFTLKRVAADEFDLIGVTVAA